MSIFDTEQAEEKLDYDVIYRKQFDDINERIYKIEEVIPILSTRMDTQKTEMDLRNLIYDLNASVQDIRNNMDAMRIMLNTILPDEQQIYFYNY